MNEKNKKKNHENHIFRISLKKINDEIDIKKKINDEK